MPQNLSESFLILPDDAFFVKILDAADALSDADAKAMAETFLEESSPLPLEHLNWGAARSKGALLVYAAAAEKIHRLPEVSERYEGAAYALPLCAIAAGAPLAGGWTVYMGEGFISALRVESGVLKDFVCRGYDESLGDDENIAAFVKSLGLGPLDYSLWALTQAKDTGFKAAFELKNAATEARLEWRLKASSLLKLSDVRPPELLRAAFKRRIYAFLTVLSASAAALALAGLIVWQALYFAGTFAASSLEREMETLSPRAKKIEAMSEQLAFLKTFSEDTLFNAYLISIANRERPKEIEFLKTSAKSPSVIEISGKADSIETVNKYVDSLAADPAVLSVNHSIPVSRSGNTQFGVTITFKPR